MTSGDTLGVYDPELDKIILKREILKSDSKFYEVLFHELVHATTGYPDNDRRFENELGKIVGNLAVELFENDKKEKNRGIRRFFKKI